MYTILLVLFGMAVVMKSGFTDEESSNERQRSRGNHAKEIVGFLKNQKTRTAPMSNSKETPVWNMLVVPVC
jgi:hypothetical protein